MSSNRPENADVHDILEEDYSGDIISRDEYYKIFSASQLSKMATSSEKFLETQNKMLETQNKMLETQNKMLETQNKLLEAQTKILEMQSNVLEIKKKTSDNIIKRPSVYKSV